MYRLLQRIFTEIALNIYLIQYFQIQFASCGIFVIQIKTNKPNFNFTLMKAERLQLQTQHLIIDTPHQLKKIQTTPPGKRYHPDTINDVSYNTIKKIRHLNQNAKVIQDIVKTVKQSCNSKRQDSHKTPQKIQKKVQISNVSLREKYAHLLPQHQKIVLPGEYEDLIKVQRLIDEHLQFSRQIRGKRKGLLFNELRQNIIQSAQNYISLQQIKQINYIQPQFYIFIQQKIGQNRFQIRIVINLKNYQSLLERKRIFRQKLYNYLKQNDGLNQKQKKQTIKIPQREFIFENQHQLTAIKKLAPNNSRLLSALMAQKNNCNQQKEAKMNHFDILIKGQSQCFKERLFKLIKEKQQNIKKMQQQRNRILNLFKSNQLLDIVASIHLSYMSKSISNMFKGTLLDMMQKKSLSTKQTLAKALIILLDIDKEKQIGYIKSIQHRQGTIIQVDKKKYPDIRKTISEKQQYSMKQQKQNK